MPGWINIPIRIEVHEKLVKARGDKSFSDFIDELLNERQSANSKLQYMKEDVVNGKRN